MKPDNHARGRNPFWGAAFHRICALFFPFGYLWPWLISVLVFIGFLTSDQGTSLAANFAEEPRPTIWVVSSITIFFMITAYGCLLSSLTAATFQHAATGSSIAKRDIWSISSIAAWICALVLAPIYAFAIMTGDTTTVWIAAFCTAIVLISAALAIRGAASKSFWWLRVEELSRRHRFAFTAIAFAIACAPLVLGALVTMRTPLALTQPGPLLVALVGVSAICTLSGVLFVVIPRSLKAPLLGWGIAAFIVITAMRAPLLFDSDNPLLREARVAAAVNESMWQEDCQVRGRVPIIEGRETEKTEGREPVYLVSAEGGGIRAAYWTAMGLAQMDLATGQRFSSQVVSLSGVSGGSLGIATWLAARDATQIPPDARIELISTFLGTDFLSPLLGGFLFLDAPRLLFGRLWPSPRRDHVFERALFDRWMELAASDFFARPLRRLCLKGFTEPPHVFFNATDALTGAGIALSNGNSGERGAFPALFQNAWEDTSLRWITVAQAVSISARFPFLSPGAEVGVTAQQIGLTESRSAVEFKYDDSSDSEVPRAERMAARASALAELDEKAEWPANPKNAMRIALLVDGGYLDNSALTPTLKAIEGTILNSNATRRTRKKYDNQSIHVVHFTNDPSRGCVPLSPDWFDRMGGRAQSFIESSKIRGLLNCGWQAAFIERSTIPMSLQFLTTPVETLFAIRRAHADVQVERILDRLFPTRRLFGWSNWGFMGVRAPGTKEFNLFSLSQAVTHFHGSTTLLVRLPYGSSDAWFLNAESIEAIYTEQKNFLQAVATNSPAINLSKHFDRLEAWRKQTLGSAARWTCAQHLSFSEPPLGWSLSKKDRALLDCLSARTTISEGFPNPTAPNYKGDHFLLFGGQEPADPYTE